LLGRAAAKDIQKALMPGRRHVAQLRIPGLRLRVESVQNGSFDLLDDNAVACCAFRGIVKTWAVVADVDEIQIDIQAFGQH